MSEVLERFLRYVRYDTQSDERATSYPYTDRQLTLLGDLVTELRDLGLTDAAMDAHWYVTATIPATSANPRTPTIGFISHVDTSPEMSGANVVPIVHRGYDGRDLILPDDPAAVLRLSEIPELQSQMGSDIVTASGTTLLGADNKAGVAEIVTAAAHLMAHPEIPHGPIRLAFTPDEIGRGTLHFDVARFGAFCAYTMDGGSRGEIEFESFSADAITVTFFGFDAHPGYAKGRMVNAIKVAADFLSRLPAGTLSPETTEDRQGFVHPYIMEAGVDKTSVKPIVKGDFVTAGLAEKEAFIESLARQAAARRPGARVEVKVEEQYRNMREVLDRFPEVTERAREAIRMAGIEPRSPVIRGGTDGSRLSFMGLPTPNLFAGEHNFHSRLEWVSVQDMEKAVEVIVYLCQLWDKH